MLTSTRGASCNPLSIFACPSCPPNSQNNGDIHSCLFATWRYSLLTRREGPGNTPSPDGEEGITFVRVPRCQKAERWTGDAELDRAQLWCVIPPTLLCWNLSRTQHVVHTAPVEGGSAGFSGPNDRPVCNLAQFDEEEKKATISVQLLLPKTNPKILNCFKNLQGSHRPGDGSCQTGGGGAPTILCFW